MGLKLVAELIAAPRAEDVRSTTTEAHGWNAYAVELRLLLVAVMETSGADTPEVEELLVSQPLPEGLTELRNGSQVNATEAADLVVGMAAGEGPYCRLTDARSLRIEPGWDGAVHFFVTSETAEELTGFRSEHLDLELRAATPEPTDVSKPIRGVVDEAFWTQVRAETEGVTLLCERWAHGAYGCRWFRVAPKNMAEVAETVRPRSLLCVVVDPDLRLEPLFLDDDFTAFRPPLAPAN